MPVDTDALVAELFQVAEKLEKCGISVTAVVSRYSAGGYWSRVFSAPGRGLKAGKIGEDHYTLDVIRELISQWSLDAHDKRNVA